ncbi:MAG: hypothetical protein EXR62_09000 [Chloroflexi bacterium]|nr:hypothetical protein [Chloroflexota bacterium]
MERVAFLIEKTGERLGCLLNPASLVLRRTAGIRSRRSIAGDLTGAGLADDPLLYTGGGRTELELELLFDVNVAGSSITTEDVRDLTRPLWQMAENQGDDGAYGRPPLIRFVWGKSWNIPAVVTAVAERLEQFTPAGVPQRSWLRLLLWRVAEPESSRQSLPVLTAPTAGLALAQMVAGTESGIRVHEFLGGGPLGLLAGWTPTLGTGLSVTGALLLASDIISMALAQTQAGALLAAARDTIAAAARSVLQTVEGWAAGVGDSPAVDAIRGAMTNVIASLGQVASAAKTRLVEVITGAVGAISVAVYQAATAARGLTADAAATVEEATSAARQALLAPIQAGLARIMPAVAAMGLAAGIVAAAVKQRSAQIIAAAGKGMAVALEEIGSIIVPVVGTTAVVGGAIIGGAALVTGVVLIVGAGAAARAAAPLVRKSAVLIQSAIVKISTELEKIKSSGKVSPAAIQAALGQVATGIEGLWSSGQAKAASAATAALQRITYALKNAVAATEAIGAVMKTKAGAAISAAAGAMGSLLGKFKPQAGVPAAAKTTGPAEIAALRELSVRLTATSQMVAAQTTAAGLLPDAAETAAVAPLPLAVHTMQQALDNFEAKAKTAAAEKDSASAAKAVVAAQAELVAQAEPALEMISAAVDRIASAEAAATDATITTTIAASAAAAEAALPLSLAGEAVLPLPGTAPALRGLAAPVATAAETEVVTNFGERLDQLAFQYMGDAALWRILAIFNDIDDPLHIVPGRLLRIPPLTGFGGATP